MLKKKLHISYNNSKYSLSFFSIAFKLKIICFTWKNEIKWVESVVYIYSCVDYVILKAKQNKKPKLQSSEIELQIKNSKKALVIYNKKGLKLAFLLYIRLIKSFPVVLVVKNPLANEGNIKNIGSIPGPGRSPGEGHVKPLLYSCLENPMGRGAWWDIVNGNAKSLTCLKGHHVACSNRSFLNSLLIVF